MIWETMKFRPMWTVVFVGTFFMSSFAGVLLHSGSLLVLSPGAAHDSVIETGADGSLHINTTADGSGRVYVNGMDVAGKVLPKQRKRNKRKESETAARQRGQIASKHDANTLW